MSSKRCISGRAGSLERVMKYSAKASTSGKRNRYSGRYVFPSAVPECEEIFRNQKNFIYLEWLAMEEIIWRYSILCRVWSLHLTCRQARWLGALYRDWHTTPEPWDCPSGQYSFEPLKSSVRATWKEQQAQVYGLYRKKALSRRMLEGLCRQVTQEARRSASFEDLCKPNGVDDYGIKWIGGLIYPLSLKKNISAAVHQTPQFATFHPVSCSFRHTYFSKVTSRHDFSLPTTAVERLAFYFFLPVALCCVWCTDTNDSARPFGLLFFTPRCVMSKGSAFELLFFLPAALSRRIDHEFLTKMWFLRCSVAFVIQRTSLTRRVRLSSL